MGKDDSQKGTRARNKTVMLTPDMANQMRAKIAGGGSTGTEKLDDELLKSIRENQAQLSSTKQAKPEASSDDSDSFRLDADVESTGGFGEVVNDETAEDSFLSLEELVNDAMVTDSSEQIDEDVKEVSESNLTEPTEDDTSRSSQTEEIAGSEIDRLLSSVNKDLGRSDNISEEPEDSFLNLGSEDSSEAKDVVKNKAEEESVSLEAGSPTELTNLDNGEEEMVAGYDLISWEKETKIVGFLVDYDSDENGKVAVLRTGRVIVSSDKVDKGSCFVIEDDSVSPMHAIILAKESGIIVLDQLSEYGTSVERQDGEKLDLSGDKASLEHGDLLSFGEKKFKVCLVS